MRCRTVDDSRSQRARRKARRAAPGPETTRQTRPSRAEPFFTTRPEGTGLGLAIAKRYVEETGGRLDIASQIGRGTTVRIWLPVASADTAPAPSQSLA